MTLHNGTTKMSSHRADRFDGGRAASEPEFCATSELGLAMRPYSQPSDDDVRALALAVIALTHAN